MEDEGPLLRPSGRREEWGLVMATEELILVFPCSKCGGKLRSVRRTALDSDRYELLCHKCGHVEPAGIEKKKVKAERPHEFIVPTARGVDLTVRLTRKTGRTVVLKRGLTVLVGRWDGGELVVLSRCGLSLADQKDVEYALRIEEQS
jgi:predicted RNA-binding Zn-ribbon protein involved in translation (DUF1610 family)